MNIDRTEFCKALSSDREGLRVSSVKWAEERSAHTEMEVRNKRADMLGDATELAHYALQCLANDSIWGPKELRDQKSRDCMDRAKVAITEALNNINRVIKTEEREINRLDWQVNHVERRYGGIDPINWDLT